MKKKRLALIFGGTSEERNVSLNTGKTIAKYLDQDKYEIFPIEINQEGKWLIESETIKEIGKQIRTSQVGSTAEIVPVEEGSIGKVDIALLALHGPGGEDGTIQGMLELLKIPYTCSGVLASSLAMDKNRTKRLVATFGVSVLPGFIVTKEEFLHNSESVLAKISGKVVVKPNRMGSSIGVTISDNKITIEKAIKDAFQHDNEVLVEMFADGREITVPVLGNRNPKTLPIVEIIPWKKSKFYDYSAKYEDGGSEHIIPAQLTNEQADEVRKHALTAHEALGCRGVTRSDFILDKNGKFWFLEINTIPGMTPVSLTPQSAKAAGIEFRELLDTLINLAFE